MAVHPKLASNSHLSTLELSLRVLDWGPIYIEMFTFGPFLPVLLNHNTDGGLTIPAINIPSPIA